MILPSSKVKFPNVEPVAPFTVPVVVKFSSPKERAPLESVILPFARVKFPNVEPVLPDTVPLTLIPASLISNLFASSMAKVILP